MVDDLAISNGLFAVTLDFGAGAFPGAARWLEIAARPGASAGGYTNLVPRQRITATPHAIKAAGVDAAGIAGTISPSSIGAGTFTGTFTGNGTGLTNVPGTVPWQTVAGTAQTAAANQGYLLTNDALTMLTLPATANLGDVVTVSGVGSNGWQVTAEAIVGGTSGVNWTPRESNRGWRSVASSADGSKLVAVVDGGRIYTSTDSGVSRTPRESNRDWRSIASSADGSKLAAVVLNGQIYTSITVLSGVAGTSVQLQYLGDGRWQPLAAQVSSLDASKITSGTLADARLSANVALRAGGNAFTGNQTVTGGNIGVGTSSPDRPLTLRATVLEGEWLSLRDMGDATRWHLNSFGGGLNIAQTGVADGRLFLSTNGNVGIGTTSPSFTLEVNGSAGKPGGGSWSVASDGRLKKNVRPLAGALDKLLALRGVNFEYIDPKKIHELSGERMGLVAQEVEKVFPDWVETGPDGYKRVTVRGLEALVVEALRELQQQQDADIDGLNKKLGEELKRRDAENAALKARLAALEKIVANITGKED